ncbi:hypothetical protein FDZ71_03080, partial [bacterium]
MAIDARRRQKAAEKRKKREKSVKVAKAKARAMNEGVGMEAVLARAGEFPIVECVISKGWEERGLAHILLARKLPNERLLVGGWYVDTLCLGIKDAAVLPGIEPADYESRIKPEIFHDKVEFEPCEPELALKITSGAADFADKIGFRPNKRWGESRHLFAGLEP